MKERERKKEREREKRNDGGDSEVVVTKISSTRRERESLPCWPEPSDLVPTSFYWM